MSHCRADTICPLLLAFLGLAPVGCTSNAVPTIINVDLAENSVLGPLEMILAPFDMVGIIDSIIDVSQPPRPDFDSLEMELDRFQPGDPAGLDSLQHEWSALRAGIVQLADSLRAVGRSTPGYRTAYTRLRRLHADITAQETDLEKQLRGLLDAEGLDLARRAIEAADTLRRWEAAALAGLPGIWDSLAGLRGRPQMVQTGISERTNRRLPAGRWWAIIRAPHPKNPFLEYFWSVPFRVNGIVPVVVPVDDHHRQVRWRH